jgi:hypothetical protein
VSKKMAVKENDRQEKSVLSSLPRKSVSKKMTVKEKVYCHLFCVICPR